MARSDEEIARDVALLMQPEVGEAAEPIAKTMSILHKIERSQGAVLDDAVINEIGAKYDKTASQVTLRWLIQQDGVTAIPRSSREGNARANFAIFEYDVGDPGLPVLRPSVP